VATPAPVCDTGLDISAAKLGAMWFTRVLYAYAYTQQHDNTHINQLQWGT